MTLPDSPFKGLAPFGDDEHDRRFFFGRERESEVVAANLMASRLTVLYGPSGVGKSSLLRAGVAQRLRAAVPAGADSGDAVAVGIVDSWRDDPLLAVAAAAGVARDLPLVDALAQRALAGGGELYLILDQMEEYVLYHGRDGGPLASALEDVLTQPDLPVHVLLGVRDDALADLDALKRRLPSLFGNVLRLDHLTRAAARTAVEGPLRAYAELGGPDVTAEDELVEAVLDEVAAGRIEQHLSGRGIVNEGVRERRVEAPFLQLVLERLWEVERERGSDVLRDSTLSELGGAEHVVRAHLERAVAGVAPHELDVVGRLFNHLVTPSGTKIAHAIEDLARYAGVEPGALEPILARLDTARIVRRMPGRAGGPPRYEIFHDVLAPAVLGWRSEHEAARALERERIEARRRHRRLGVVAVLALTALAGTLALAAWALAKRDEARDQARSAEARELAAAALSELGVDPERSLRLAVRAARLEPSERSEDVLRRALLESRLRRAATSGGPAGRLAVTPDGRLLVAGPGELRVLSEDLELLAERPYRGRALQLTPSALVTAAGRRVTVVEPLSGSILLEVSAPGAELPRHGALSADRRLLALSDGSRRTVLVDTLSGQIVREVDGSAATTALLFAPGSRALAVGAADGSTRIWALPAGRRPTILAGGHVGHVVDVAFATVGGLVATASTDGTARVWRVPQAQAVSVLPAHENHLTGVEFSPDGLYLATSGRDGTARVWRAETAEARATLRGHGGPVAAAAFLRHGGRVATVGADGGIRSWDTRRYPVLRLLGELGSPVTAVRFRESGFEAVTEDGTLHLLDSDGVVVGTGAAPPRRVARARDGTTATIEGKSVRLRRPDGRTLVLAGHRDAVTSADFSPDGRRLVTGSRDHEPIVWDVDTGRARMTLLAHFAIVSDARFSPDGRWIATAGPEKVGLWDASTGALVHLLQGHEDIVLSVAFDATSRRILTGGRDGTIRVWRCPVCGPAAELLPVAEARLAATRR